MKKTIISSAIAAILAATSLITHSTWASDRDIYQRGGEGSTALMLTLDITETMRGIRGELNDGFSDYYMCNQATNNSSHIISVNSESFKVRFCRYTTTGYGILELGEKLKDFIIPGRYKSYTDYINQTCTYREDSSIEYICYDRLSKAKIALLSLLVGNPERGIGKLSDDKVIGLTTFSAYHQTADKLGSFAGKVNIKPRRLDERVTLSDGTKITQRKLLIETIKTIDDIDESLLEEISKGLDGNRDSNSPIASAYTEAAAALMGTTTKGAGLRVIGRKDAFGKLQVFYKCEGNWDINGYCPLTKWKIVESSLPKVLLGAGSVEELDSFIKQNYPSDGTFFRNDRPIESNENKESDGPFLGTTYYYVNDANKEVSYSGFSYANVSSERNQATYNRPTLIQNQLNNSSLKSCHAQGIYMLTGGTPYIKNGKGSDYSPEFGVERMMQRTLAPLNSTQQLNTSFKCFGQNINSTLKDSEKSGVGLLKDNTMWACLSNFTEALKDPNKNPTNLEIKTAIAGMGRYFSDLPDTKGVDLESATAVDDYFNQVNNTSFSKRFLELKDESEKHNIRNTAKLGALGGGGFYSALSVEEIAESVNHFINYMAKDIPSVSANKAVIPVDVLNPYELQPYAYLTMYEPSVQGAVAAWAGNLKRYGVSKDGMIVAKDKNSIFKANSTVRDDAEDLWQNTSLSVVEAAKKSIFQGGALNKIQLRHHDVGGERTYQRTVYTTRKCITKENNVACEQDPHVKLTQLNRDYFTDKLSGKDSLRGYLLGLLGYDVLNPKNINNEEILKVWEDRPELRQMGAVLHSDPIVLTQEATFDNKDNQKVVSRKDYVLFGTTQGLLHVIDAEKGDEKFAFVPNEMVESNYHSFLDPNFSSTGNDFKYGIDGPWTVHTEYVTNQDESGKLTTLTVGKVVGQDKTAVQGKQWVYGGLRMGGRSYYALDLSDLKIPKVKFHIDPENKRVVTPEGPYHYPELEYMGQSWSKPVITYVDWQGERKLVMFVGGGYDSDPQGMNQGYEHLTYQQENGQGAGVYMFDADTGKLLWWASSNVGKVDYEDQTTSDTNLVPGLYTEKMAYSVVSAIKTVDRDGDSLTDHLYFGDLGGQVWRIDIDNFRKSGDAFAKRAVRLLNHEEARQQGRQPRFYVEPTFGIYRLPTSGRVIASLSIGSGNASSPLHNPDDVLNWVKNAIFTIYDKDVTRTGLYKLQDEDLNKDLSLPLLTKEARDAENKFTPERYEEEYQKNSGWQYVFSDNSATVAGQDFYTTPMGPKVISDPVLMNNQLFVSVFDSERKGTVQGCDAGIRGESVIERFCMPFGSCGSSSGMQNSLYAGVGIAPINISSAGQGANNSRKIINSQCEGDSCSITGTANNAVASDNKLNRKLSPMRWFERE